MTTNQTYVKTEVVGSSSKSVSDAIEFAITTASRLLRRFEASVYCSRCYEHRSIDPAAEHLRDRCFARALFRCTKIRYTGDVCGCPGSVGLMPTVRLAVGGNYDLAFLSCESCVPRSEINFVPIDQPPWSVVRRKAGGRLGQQRGDRQSPPAGRRFVDWSVHAC